MADIELRAREELKQSRSAVMAAKEEIRDTRRRIARLLIKIETLTDLLDGVNAPVPSTTSSDRVVVRDDDDEDEPGGSPPELAPARDGPFANMTTNQVIEKVLDDAGHKLRITEIVSRAVNNGYGGFGGADPDRIFAVFSSALSRDVKSPSPRFHKIGRGVFDLASRHVAF